MRPPFAAMCTHERASRRVRSRSVQPSSPDCLVFHKLGSPQVSTARITAPEAKDRTVVPRVSVVIPARNEARNLSHVLGALPADLHEVILVDGHSLDGTVEAA